MQCRECGSKHKVSPFDGGPLCDACVFASMDDGPAVVVYPSWVSNEDHFGGLNYAKDRT
jgi:hypothetical protein